MRYNSHSNGSGRSVAWLARLLGVQEVESSNLSAPTIFQSVFPPPHALMPDYGLKSVLYGHENPDILQGWEPETRNSKPDPPVPGLQAGVPPGVAFAHVPTLSVAL